MSLPETIRIHLTVLGTLGSVALFGCSCSPPPVDLPVQEMGLTTDSTDVGGVEKAFIFEGILIASRKDTIGHQELLANVFEVTDVYRGNCTDTITVWTAPHSAACGFTAFLHDYAIIVAAKREDGRYHNARTDCWRGVNRKNEPGRFEDYRKFLISIKYGIDGTYHFTQRLYHDVPDRASIPVLPQLIYRIVDQKLDGNWWLYNRSGHLVEHGWYDKGRRSGNWIYILPTKDRWTSKKVPDYSSIDLGFDRSTGRK